MNLGDDVDFEEIAAGSENFSGADLQAVISTAQLSSLEHLLHSDEKVGFASTYFFQKVILYILSM